MISKTAINVLVVDDDPDDVYLIGEAIGEIEEGEFEISSCNSPLDAINSLAEKSFDVIFSDYRLGATTGIEFIKSVRSSGIDTPIILLTGVGDTSIDKEALEAGASDYLPKSSLSPESLDRAMRYAIANIARQRLLQSVVDNSDAGVALVNPNCIATLWNPAFENMALSVMSGSNRDCVNEFAAYAITWDEDDLKIGDRTIERHTSVLPDGDIVVFLHDVTERVKSMEERLEADRRIAFLAHHDSLTGLPNREAFSQRLAAEIQKGELTGSRLFVLNLDLNKFKEVNDVFGHAVGDGLLREIAARLRACMREDEFVARLGGDEFVALQRVEGAAGSAPEFAERIIESTRGPFIIEGHQIHTGISIGVSIAPDHGSDPEQVLANADAAMYRAKSNPLQQYSMFDESLDRAIRQRRALANDLKDAVAANQLEVYLQPQAMVKSRQIIGFEALARWNHPTLGWVSPSTFIPIAEESGLIIPMGDWILRKACEIAAEWDMKQSIAVNVSAIQLGHSDLPNYVKSVIEDTGLSPSQLEIEVTESLLIDDPDRAVYVLHRLRDLGVSIAMDDFGTGYSSLSSLISFPFDKIKIDRSFIENIDSNSQAREIIRAILGLGRNLRFKVIAEGVESEAHVGFLRAEGCEKMQGYLIGRPETPERVWEQIVSAGYHDDRVETQKVSAVG